MKLAYEWPLMIAASVAFGCWQNFSPFAGIFAWFFLLLWRAK